MNGRVYDPNLGRMLQADPFIQSPTNTQSFNRYSYGFNNPLSGIDPSGYSFLGDVGDFFEKAIVNGVKAYVSVAACNYWAAACYAGLSTAEAKAQGASWADAALNGAVSGAAFYAGDQISFSGYSAGSGEPNWLNVSIVMPEFNATEISSGKSPSRTAAQIVEGTDTTWTGGKFPNGARTATFASLLNAGTSWEDEPCTGGCHGYAPDNEDRIPVDGVLALVVNLAIPLPGVGKAKAVGEITANAPEVIAALAKYNAHAIFHLFGRGGDAPAALIKQFGSQEAALAHLQAAAQGIAKQSYQSGAWVSVKVGQTVVTIKGTVIDGYFRISSIAKGAF